MGPEIRQKELRTGPAGACGCAEGTGGDRVCRSWQSFGSVQPPLPGGFRLQHVSWHFDPSRAVLTAAALPSLDCCNRAPSGSRPGRLVAGVLGGALGDSQLDLLGAGGRQVFRNWNAKSPGGP